MVDGNQRRNKRRKMSQAKYERKRRGWRSKHAKYPLEESDIEYIEENRLTCERSSFSDETMESFDAIKKADTSALCSKNTDYVSHVNIDLHSNGGKVSHGMATIDTLSSSSEESTDESEDLNDLDKDSESTLWEDLQMAAIETNMSDYQVNRILRVLRNHDVGPLPLDSRTLKSKSSSKLQIEKKSGMEYYNFGYANQIRYALGRYPKSIVDNLALLLIKDNVDGLPLFKSSNLSCWPLLAKIDNLLPHLVFPVVITVGVSKPQNLEFLNDVVEEMRDISRNGVKFNGRTFDVDFSAHICDTPARRMVKSTMSFNSFFGCDYCESRAISDGKRLIWTQTDFVERTDESFRQRRQSGHHKPLRSPFEDLPCDMINAFPYDVMHLYSGLMMRILNWITSGPKIVSHDVPCRISASKLLLLNERLKVLRQYIPNCFARRPRTLKELQRFKATEMRQLLLYTSKVVFRDILATQNHYEHMCGLSIACSLLCDSSKVESSIDLCSNLFKSFVSKCRQLYGDSFLVYNVHSLLHLPKTAAVHGNLDSVAAYAFESKLGELKKTVRSPLRPIVSLVRNTLLQQESNKGDLIIKRDTKIYFTHPNNVYIDVRHHICYEAYGSASDKTIEVRKYLTVRPYLTKPVESSLVGCYKVNTANYVYDTKRTEELKSMRRGMKIDLSSMPGLEEPNQAVFMAMLHDSHEEKFC